MSLAAMVTDGKVRKTNAMSSETKRDAIDER